MRPVRVVRRLREGARTHEASFARVVIHATRQRRGGWNLGELAAFGLLDPRNGPDRNPWAVPASEVERLVEALNPEEHIPLCEDKRLFTPHCQRHALPTPALVAVLERPPDDDATVGEWTRILDEDGPAGVVIKPSNGHRGLGVRVLTRGPEGFVDHRGGHRDAHALAGELAREPWDAFIVQERAYPHPALREMSGHDLLHTLRIVTLVGEGGRSRMLGGWMRIGGGQEPVDSFRSGSTNNLVAGVGEDGTLATPFGLAESGFGLVHVTAHPRTGVPLAGFRVPDWDAAREVALRAADAFSCLRTVGWDIAPTPDGPTIVEGNAWWALPPDPDGAEVPTTVEALRAAAAGCR